MTDIVNLVLAAVFGVDASKLIVIETLVYLYSID